MDPTVDTDAGTFLDTDWALALFYLGLSWYYAIFPCWWHTRSLCERSSRWEALERVPTTSKNPNKNKKKFAHRSASTKHTHSPPLHSSPVSVSLLVSRGPKPSHIVEDLSLRTAYGEMFAPTALTIKICRYLQVHCREVVSHRVTNAEEKVVNHAAHTDEGGSQDLCRRDVVCFASGRTRGKRAQNSE